MSNEPSPHGTPGAQTPPPPPADPGQAQQSPYQSPATQPASAFAMTAPAAYAPNQDERTMGMLIHLLAIFTWIFGPLILWLVKREGSGFIDHNGKEAVNFQISLLIYSLGLALFSAVTLGFGLILAIPAGIGLSIAALVFEILCCVKANKGEWPRYPICIRFIK